MFIPGSLDSDDMVVQKHLDVVGGNIWQQAEQLKPRGKADVVTDKVSVSEATVRLPEAHGEFEGIVKDVDIESVIKEAEV